MKFGEGLYVKEAKEKRVRRWQRPREETVSVRTREEGARVQGGAVLSSFATTETNEQLKDDEKKGKQPGIGDPRTQEENSQGSGPQNPWR